MIFLQWSHISLNSFQRFCENTWNSRILWRYVMGIDCYAILGAGGKFGCFCRWNVFGWWRHIMPWCTTMYQKMAPYSGLARILVVLHNTWWHRAICMIIPPRPSAHLQIGTYNSWKAFSLTRPSGCYVEQLRNWNRNLGGGRSAVGGFNPHCNLDISRGTGPCTSLAWLTVSSSRAALPS